MNIKLCKEWCDRQDLHFEDDMFEEGDEQEAMDSYIKAQMHRIEEEKMVADPE